MTTTMKPNRLCYRAVEFRAEESDGRTLEGYAAVFDQPTMIDSWEGTFEEVIKRGAFKRSIAERMPVLQFNHGRDTRTGQVPIGAIEELREDRKGLYVRAGLFDNDLVLPIRQAIAGGAIDGMSFRFRVMREVWTDKNGKTVSASELAQLLWNAGDRGPLKRSVREVELPELGPVVFPQYRGTSVGVRSLLADLDPDEREELVRELAAEMNRTTDDAGDDATSSGDEENPDAAPEGTSGGPDAGHSATSGLGDGERAAALRRLELLRR